jgi:hypothetical protein
MNNKKIPVTAEELLIHLSKDQMEGPESPKYTIEDLRERWGWLKVHGTPEPREPHVMNPLLDSMERTFDSCLSTARRKNADYAGEGDPFKNFLNSKVVGVPPQQGVMVRLMDKMSRVGNLVSTGR